MQIHCMWVIIACIVMYRNHTPLAIKALSSSTYSFHSFVYLLPLSLSLSVSFCPILQGFHVLLAPISLMHSSFQDLYVGLIAIIAFGYLFFALFGGFLGGRRCEFYLPGFFELNPCLSSSDSLVCSRIFLFQLIDLLIELFQSILWQIRYVGLILQIIFAVIYMGFDFLSEFWIRGHG